MERKRQVNLENRSLEEKKFGKPYRKIWGQKRPQGIWGEVQKKEKNEEGSLAPFYLNTHLRLGLLKSNYDL